MVINDLAFLERKIAQAGYSISFVKLPGISSQLPGCVLLYKKSLSVPKMNEEGVYYIRPEHTEETEGMSKYHICMETLFQEIAQQLADAEEFLGQDHSYWFKDIEG